MHSREQGSTLAMGRISTFLITFKVPLVILLNALSFQRPCSWSHRVCFSLHHCTQRLPAPGDARSTLLQFFPCPPGPTVELLVLSHGSH